jgi:hypothetical protein
LWSGRGEGAFHFGTENLMRLSEGAALGCSGYTTRFSEPKPSDGKTVPPFRRPQSHHDRERHDASIREIADIIQFRIALSDVRIDKLSKK